MIQPYAVISLDYISTLLAWTVAQGVLEGLYKMAVIQFSYLETWNKFRQLLFAQDKQSDNLHHELHSMV